MSIVQDFARAFNRQDVGVLVACFTETASYHDTFYGEHAGHTKLRAMFERMFREGRDYSWAMDLVVDSSERAAAEYFDSGQALLQLGFAPEGLAKVLRRKLEAH